VTVAVSSRLRRIGLFVVLGLGVVLIAIQFVPYGERTSNGAVRREPNWDSPRTRELAVRACFDCHSHQVQYPWYSNVAPMSWLVHHDIHEARLKMNVSEWDLPQREAQAAVEQIEKGDMPLSIYVPLHPDARLSAEEKQALIHGIEATFTADRPRRR
jgi:hypothetical protein